MSEQTREEAVTEFLTPKVVSTDGVAPEVDHTVYPMPQDKQPDPFYGFEPPRDESKYTGAGYVHPENQD